MIGTLQNSSESHLYEVTELHSLVHGCLDEPREVPRYDCKRSRIARLSFLVSIRQVIRRMSNGSIPSFNSVSRLGHRVPTATRHYAGGGARDDACRVPDRFSDLVRPSHRLLAERSVCIERA